MRRRRSALLGDWTGICGIVGTGSGPTCYHGVGRAPRWRLPGRYGTSFKSTRRLRRLATALRSLALAPVGDTGTAYGARVARVRLGHQGRPKGRGHPHLSELVRTGEVGVGASAARAADMVYDGLVRWAEKLRGGRLIGPLSFAWSVYAGCAMPGKYSL